MEATREAAVAVARRLARDLAHRGGGGDGGGATLVGRLPPHCGARGALPPGPGLVFLAARRHDRPPLCRHPALRVACGGCGLPAGAGAAVYHEPAMARPFTVECAACAAAR